MFALVLKLSIYGKAFNLINLLTNFKQIAFQVCLYMGN